MRKKRVQIASNIDPDIKHRLEMLQVSTRMTFRRTLEQALKIGLARMERQQKVTDKALEQFWDREKL